jgi:hypothetical protein
LGQSSFGWCRRNLASLNLIVRQHVGSSRTKIVLLIALGLLAPLWWTWTASQLAFRIYIASGSPSRPGQGILWASLYVPAAVIGLMAGFIAAFLAAASPLKGWLIFAGSVLLGATVVGVFAGAAPWAYVASLFSSFGNALFWVGSIAWPLVAHVRGRAV